jgi:pimeloyl-ACP methyl ester carboxylesterase
LQVASGGASGENAAMEESIEHDGCRLAYRVEGEGVPVVMIQGVGVHGQGWRPQVQGLRDVCQCLTFDNRGMGKSQAVTGGLGEITVERMAADTLTVMDAAGFASAHVVGHSLGGLVALELALRARQRVKSLALLCTMADGRVALKLTPLMLWLGTLSRIGPRWSRRRAFMRIVMSREGLRRGNEASLAAQLAELFGHDLAIQPPIVGPQLRALKKYDATARLAELAGISTLVISGSQDPIARPAEGGRVLARGIGAARYEEWPDAAHGLPIEFAQRVNGLLRGHIVGTAKAP